MADVGSNLKDWSTTASSNNPTSSTTVGSGLAPNRQEIQKVVRQDLAYKGADIASATTTDIGAVAGSYHDITGTTTITSFGTVSAGITKVLQFDGALTLTHNATSLILPGAGNITTAAGDHLYAVSLGSGNWVVPWYGRAAGTSAVTEHNYKNAVDNPDFMVWQRSTAGIASVSGSQIYTADRWHFNCSGAGTVSVAPSTSVVPTVAQAGRLIAQSIAIDVTGADASIATSDFYLLQQKIEGYRWAQFAQQALTLSFWVRTTITGTYCVNLQNGTDRSYIGTYTVNAGDTWEYKTVSFLASPSAGTWNYTTNTGAALSFVLAAGSTYQGSAGSWLSSTAVATSGQVNAMSSASNFFYLAGVQLERGPQATAFEAVPFAMELARCQRYYVKSFPYATAPAQNTGSNLGAIVWINILGGAVGGGSQSVPFPTRMRTAPTITLYNPGAANAQIRNLSTPADWSGSAASGASEVGFYVTGTQNAGASAGSHTHAVHWDATADL